MLQKHEAKKGCTKENLRAGNHKVPLKLIIYVHILFYLFVFYFLFVKTT